MFQLIANGDLIGLQEELKNIKDLSLSERLGVLSNKEGGKTLLHAAIEKGNIAILKTLLVVVVPLNINDDTGQPILHAAVIKGSMEIIQELIALDVSLTELDQAGKTAENIAQEMESQKNSDVTLYKEIGALLRTRREWQEAAVSFRFNKVVHMIPKSFPAIKPASGYDKIFFIGSTGAGKSTLLNYLNGARYMVDKDEADKPFAELIDGEEIAIIGQGMDSQTLYPQVVPENGPKEGTNFVYCDLAGLADKGGFERRIIAASSVQALSRLPGNIKGILVVLDIPGFNAARAETFINTAVAFAKMINFNTALMDSVYFVITKASSRVRPRAIKTTYIRPMLERLEKKKLLEGSLSTEEEALRFMLEQIQISDDEKILIPDITDNGASREALERKLTNLTGNASNSYNFISHDGAQKSFNDVLLTIAQSYVDKINKLDNRFPDQIKDEEEKQRQISLRIEDLNNQLQARRDDLTQPYNETAINTLIQQKKGKVTSNNTTIGTKRNEIITLEREIDRHKDALTPLDTNQMIPVDRVKYDIHGRPGGPREHDLKYQSQYPCFGPGSVGGFFWGWGNLSSELLPECDGLKGLYATKLRASDGLHRVDVEIFTHNKYIHKAEISRLNTCIDDCRQKKYAAEREIIRLENENERIKEEIFQCEKEKIEGKADHKIRENRLNTEIQALEVDLVQAKKELADSRDIQKRIERQKEDIQYELKVNQSLFQTVYEVTLFLDLDHRNTNPDISDFRCCFRNNNPEADFTPILTQFRSFTVQSSGWRDTDLGLQDNTVGNRNNINVRLSHN